jgi:uncharacterized protein
LLSSAIHPPFALWIFLNKLDLLERLFGNIILPPAVAWELLRPPERFRPIDPGLYHYLKVLPPQNISQVLKFQETLDVGEAEALVLAIEKNADFVLMDESLGRNVAQELGMTPLGLVGILLRAKERNFVDSIIPLIDSLQSDLDFFKSPSLRQDIILRSGE